MRKNYILFIVFLIAVLLLPVVILNYGISSNSYSLNNSEVNVLLHELSDEWDTIKYKSKERMPARNGKRGL